MIRILKCGDLMPGCDYVVRSQSDEAVLEEAAVHALNVHGVTVTPELAERARRAIRVG